MRICNICGKTRRFAIVDETKQVKQVSLQEEEVEETADDENARILKKKVRKQIHETTDRFKIKLEING